MTRTTPKPMKPTKGWAIFSDGKLCWGLNGPCIYERYWDAYGDIADTTDRIARVLITEIPAKKRKR